MIQKIAILVAREGRVTGTQIFSVYEVGEDAECSSFFFSPNMSAYFLLRDVSIYLTHSCVHVS